jgi:hypothetical protein
MHQSDLKIHLEAKYRKTHFGDPPANLMQQLGEAFQESGWKCSLDSCDKLFDTSAEVDSHIQRDRNEISHGIPQPIVSVRWTVKAKY